MKNIQEKIKQIWVKSKMIEPDEKLNGRHWIALLLTGITLVLWSAWKIIKFVLAWCIIFVYGFLSVVFVVAVYKSIFG